MLQTWWEALCFPGTQISRWIMKRNLSFICMFDSVQMKDPSQTVGATQIYGEKRLAGWLAESLDFLLLIQMFWLHGGSGSICQADLRSPSEGRPTSTERLTGKWAHGIVVCEMRSPRLRPRPRRVTDPPVHFQVLLTDEPPICIRFIMTPAETVTLLLVLIIESSPGMYSYF